MRIVVTGASGNVGTALLRALPNSADVVALARRLPNRDRTPYHRALWVTTELGGPDAPEVLRAAIAGADAVVHLAWSINPARTDPPADRTNLLGTRQVLDAAARAQVPHMVCLSSVAAYRPGPRWAPVTEDWPCYGVPGSSYSLGKARLESLLDEFTDVMAITRLRPCAIVQRAAGGQFTRWLLGPLIPARWIGRVPLPIWRGLRLQAVHADDVADAIIRAITRRMAGAFNLAADPVMNGTDLGDVLGVPTIRLPRRPLLAAGWAGWRIGVSPLHPGWLRLADRAALADTGRARHQLGWQPTHTATEAIRELVSGVRQGGGWASPPLRAESADRPAAPGWGRPSHQSQS